MPESSSSVPDAPTVEQLLVMLAERDRVIAELSARVAELETRLGKNSQNSSKPPSSDNPFVKPAPRSLRKRSGRNPGKQAGEPGARLEPRPDPDEIVVHTPVACGSCGSDLAAAPVVGDQRRQVFDLPVIWLRAVEHRAQQRRCDCGRVTTAQFPAQASAPACYGPRGGRAGDLPPRPSAPAAELMADCLGAPVSTGWLASLLPAAAEGLDGFTAVARAQLAAAPVAHFDEDRRARRGKAVVGTRGLHRGPDPVPPGTLTGPEVDGPGRGAPGFHRCRGPRRVDLLPPLRGGPRTVWGPSSPGPGRGCREHRPCLADPDG